MRILCAPDSFKESLTARDAAEAMACGVRKAMPAATVDLCPVADGGEGLVDAWMAATAGTLHRATVAGPLNEPVEATWGLGGNGTTAVIEMAAAAGLALVPPHRRDPTKTTTRGVGELLAAALDAGVTRIILGLGGSATCDAGCGAAQALGLRFIDHQDHPLDHPLTGSDLLRIARIDTSRRHPRLDDAELLLACDVTNPLAGPDGAAHVYAPQKGATPEQVRQLDQGLHHIASVFQAHAGMDIQTLPGAGAAGGFGGGCVALLGGQLRQGIDLVLEAVRFETRIQQADLCLTGEGRLDGQTLYGKAIAGVARTAQRYGVPVIALVGSLGPGHERAREIGIEQARAIGEGLPVEESIRRARDLLTAATARAVTEHLHAPKHR